MDMGRAERYVNIKKRLADMEVEEKRLREEARELEAKLLDDFAEHGLSSIKANGVTLYVRRTLWAKARGGDYDATIAALEASDMGDFVQRRFNTHSLSAYVREKERNGEELPEALRDAIEVTESFELRALNARST